MDERIKAGWNFNELAIEENILDALRTDSGVLAGCGRPKCKLKFFVLLFCCNCFLECLCSVVGIVRYSEDFFNLCHRGERDIRHSKDAKPNVLAVGGGKIDIAFGCGFVNRRTKIKGRSEVLVFVVKVRPRTVEAKEIEVTITGEMFLTIAPTFFLRTNIFFFVS